MLVFFKRSFKIRIKYFLSYISERAAKSLVFKYGITCVQTTNKLMKN